jgi:hypothetical protein
VTTHAERPILAVSRLVNNSPQAKGGVTGRKRDHDITWVCCSRSNGALPAVLGISKNDATNGIGSEMVSNVLLRYIR